MINQKRFETKFKRGSNDECWNWEAALLRCGYGVFGVNRKNRYAHRVSYELYNEKIPTGAWVLHSCDNRKCVNPNHLFIGNAKINSRDMVTKNRQHRAFGIENTNCKLSDDDITKVREMRSYGYFLKEISQSFGISVPHVSNIVNKKRRSEIGENNE